jgi:hypothetical protein
MQRRGRSRYIPGKSPILDLYIRYVALVLTFWYLICSTQLAFAMFEWIGQQTNIQTDISCDCASGEQKHTQCCCTPKLPLTPDDTSCFTSAICGGHFSEFGLIGYQKIHSHILSALPSLTQPLYFETVPTHVGSTPPSRFVDLPDKIPI